MGLGIKVILIGIYKKLMKIKYISIIIYIYDQCNTEKPFEKHVDPNWMT